MREREKCQYKNSIVYVVDALGKEFVCDRDAVLDGYCEFHHPSYWERNGEELRRKFYEIVEDAMKNNKPLIAIGYHLPEIDLRGKIFKIPVLFMDTKFYINTYFDGAKFHNETFFSGAEFCGETKFDGAEFHVKAIFFKTEFRNNTYFDGAKFHSETFFGVAKFHGEASFNNVEFRNNTIFSDVAFHGEASFFSTKFHNKTYFSVEFHEGVIFSGAEFHEGASFSGKFCGEAKFDGAEFHGGTIFSGVEFHGGVNFNMAKFHNKTLFSGVKFHRGASFFKTEFRKNTLFKRVKFSNEVMFENSVFIVSFNEYASDKLFKMMLKREDTDKSEILDSVSFLGAIFPEAPHKAIFDHTYLGRVSFLGTNIERIDFRNVVWPETGGRYMAFDEALLRLKTDEKLREKLLSKLDENKRKDHENIINSPDVTIVNVVSVYSMLRENYEYFLKYDEAGKFFISEMEVKRLIGEDKTKSSKNGAEVRTGYKLNGWLRRNLSILGLYKHIALYGETAHRQLFIFTPLLIVFFWGLRIMTGTCSVETCNYFEQLVDSIAAYMQVPRAATLIDTIERLISIPILSTVFIALRRKLERRYRH